MRYASVLVLAFASVAHAGDPNSNLPARKVAQCTLPAKPCDCAPCTCDPAKCTCPNCDTGCKKNAAQGEQLAFVGSDPFQTTPTTVETPVSQTPAGYHVEYRQVCNGSSCQMVPVTVADGAPVQSCATCAGGTCATGNCFSGGCATGNCGSQGGCSSGSCGSGGGCGAGGCGRSGPVRRIFGRIFHRR